MDDEGPGCGPLHALYTAARADDVVAVRARWPAAERALATLDPEAADRVDEAQTAGDTETVRSVVAGLLFRTDEAPTLDDVVSRLLGAALFGFGYLASYVLFLGAHTPTEVVGRLRWAYRTVGVEIRDTETVEGAERTVFRCPYRNLGADRFGRRRVCHDVLDLVDDGYVRWLARHRDIAYDRPRACAASECCYSVVTQR